MLRIIHWNTIIASTRQNIASIQQIIASIQQNIASIQQNSLTPCH